MDAGLRGIADLHDGGTDEQLETADVADAVLGKLGMAMEAVWPYDNQARS